MKTVLNRSNLRRAHDLARFEENYTFNCWGATLYALGIASDLYWVDQPDICEFLLNDTYVLDKTTPLRKGDILVIMQSDRMVEHTAVYAGLGLFWHKKGGLESSFDTLEDIYDFYNDYGNSYYEIRRLKEDS